MTAALAETAYRRSDTGAREPVPGALPCGCEYASRSVHTLTRHAPIVTSVSADGKINIFSCWSAGAPCESSCAGVRMLMVGGGVFCSRSCAMDLQWRRPWVHHTRRGNPNA